MKLVRIHKGNYEAYMLDRMEGKLPADLSRELDLFLAQNPQLAEELEGMDELSFVAEPVAFDAHALKRSEHELVDEQSFVAYIENQLNTEDRLSVEKSVANNPALQQELALFKKTILEPDAGIIYTPKSELKRKAKVIWLNPQYARYAAAAVLLLFLGLAFIWNRQQLQTTLADDLHKGAQKTSPLVKQETRQKATENLPMLANDAVNPANQLPKTKAVKEPKHEPLESLQPQRIAPQEEHLVANQHPVKQDTIQSQPVAVSNNIKANEAPAIASTHKVMPVTIIESDDEDNDAASSKKKTGLWAFAGRALKGLNKAGLKTVDGNEKDSPKTTDYLLTLGGIQVTHSQTMN